MFRTAYLLCAEVLLVATCFGQTRPPTDPLADLNDRIGALIRTVAPSVVQITVNGYGPQADSQRRNTGVTIGRQRSLGSGFVIDTDGYIVTNAHVVSGSERIEVVLPPDTSKGA